MNDRKTDEIHRVPKTQADGTCQINDDDGSETTEIDKPRSNCVLYALISACEPGIRNIP